VVDYHRYLLARWFVYKYLKANGASLYWLFVITPLIGCLECFIDGQGYWYGISTFWCFLVLIELCLHHHFLPITAENPATSKSLLKDIVKAG